MNKANQEFRKTLIPGFFLLLIFVGIFSCETKEVTPEKTLPTVQTINTFVANEFSLSLKGVISSDGFDNQVSHGFLYSLTNTKPELNGEGVASVATGAGVGTFTLILEGLQRNSTYYIRAYASNSKGTAYGDVLTMRTTTGAPASFDQFAIEPDLTNDKQLIFSANISSKGSSDVTERGVCWDTKAEPIAFNQAGNSSRFRAFGSGEGNFDGVLTGLTSNTSYFVRPYARNQAGTAYGPEIRVSTIGLGTSEITSINADRFGISLRGSATSYGGLALIEQGYVWGTMATPTITNGKKVVTNNSSTQLVTNIPFDSLKVGLTYNIRSYITNSLGTGYGDVRKVIYYPLGAEFRGGIIFFVTNETTPKVMIAALNDIDTVANWGCMGDSVKTDGTLNRGNANTTAMIQGCPSDLKTAARRCRAYSATHPDGTTTSWDLPTVSDLQKMEEVLKPMGKFNLSTSNKYWTSVQSSESRAMSFQVIQGAWATVNEKKNVFMSIRPVKTI